jgi:transposase
MAFDEHGLPLAHEVFEGNIADTKTLVTLLKAERGFRMLKSSLGLRPNYHQLEHREAVSLRKGVKH